MENQRIVDVGKHSDLLRRCERYRDLIKRQQTSNFDTPVGDLPPSRITINDEFESERRVSADNDELSAIIKGAQQKLVKPGQSSWKLEY
jgi:hypothetical protein